MIIDLSHPLYSGMPVYPGDPEVRVIPALSHETDQYSVHTITLGTHSGTHLDAPYHRYRNGITVDHQAVLAATVGDAQVIEPALGTAGDEIRPSDLGAGAASISPGARILLATGWSEHFGREDYSKRFPSVSVELAEYFADHKIALLGIETPSVHTREGGRVHEILLSAGIIIVENLANLRSIAGKRVFFSAAPLKLSGLDGSPVRAYAIIQESGDRRLETE